ncbi:MAG: ribulose-phosphate 3-epimerase [Phycisphaerae bacterium]|nr:ribulose-phosphate 3-epimerase [Phycisphaerae bacterium]
MRNLITHPPRLPLIAASILSADFARMGAECDAILNQGADLLHVDVMDGHFVPNLTMGPDMVRAVRRAVPRAFLDVHLMVRDPDRFVGPFAEAGADHLTFHIEVTGPGRAETLAERVHALGCTAGLAFNPGTSVDDVRSLIGPFQLFLVMSVNPGFSGQAFITDVLPKTEAIAASVKSDQRIQMDGGIKVTNSAQVRRAGCDVMVVASGLFGASPVERPRIITELRGVQ